LTDEIREAFADVEGIRGGAKLNSLVYLRACIDETLMPAPPAPTYLRGQQLQVGLQTYEFFPEGAVVRTSAYCISHREDYYPAAWEFRPGRWILVEGRGEASKESSRFAKEAFCAFSLGARRCVRRSVTYLELIWSWLDVCDCLISE
jgi:cytochrome P450